MKKLLVTLCLLLALLAVGCGLAEGLPEVGETVNGFTVQEIRAFPAIDALVVRFVHDKTGAQLFYFANDDTNRVYQLAFHTVAVDETGLPHVFEHATLGGSEKYPSKRLFMNLSNQTYNSYMNASTTDVITYYPVASLSEAQLLKLADFYIDSCLHPMIMTDESIFSREAWRYRLMGEDEPLTIEGTVYSEMLGANTIQRAASLNSYKAAFPGSTIGNNHGGVNDDIPNLTWEAVKAYHDTYYHPSNCTVYLYGEFEDYASFLALTDEAFSAYEPRETVFDDPGYTPITEPVTLAVGFPTEQGSSTDLASYIEYVFVLGDCTPDQYVALQTLGLLLGADSSPLMTALNDALPTGSFSVGYDLVSPSPAMVFSAENVNPEDAETFRTTVDTALAAIAETGFTQDLVDSFSVSLEIEMMLLRESASVGVESILPNFAYYGIGTGNPWCYMDYIDGLDQMEALNNEGVYSDMIRHFLVESTTNALVTTYPEPGGKEAVDEARAARLAEVKAGMSAEEISTLIAASTAEDDSEAIDPATAAMVTALTAVQKDTLPEEIKRYDVQDSTDDNGLRFIETPAGVEGIGQADILLDASGIAPEDLHYLCLLVNLPYHLNSAHHTLAELNALSDRYLYSGNIRTSIFDAPDGKPLLKLRASWIAMNDDLAQGYDLMYEMIFELDLDDTEALLNTVRSVKSSLRSSINGSAYNILVYRAFARDSEVYKLYNYNHFVEYYQFLDAAEKQLAEDPETFTANLKRVREQLRNSTGITFLYSGDSDGFAVNRPLAQAFAARLNSEPITPVSYDSIPVPAASEALIIDSNAQFNLIAAPFSAVGMEEYTGTMDAVTGMVNDTLLIPLLRDQYGAYGVMHGAMDEYGFYIVSYRDPNIAETFAVYDQLSTLVAGLELDQETLDGYILSSYSYYATPVGELSGAVGAAVAYLDGDDPDANLHYMQQLKALTAEDLKGYADVYAAIAANGTRSTAAGASAINANAERYEVILNPFGVEAVSADSLTDLPEDHPNREAIEFMIENSMMAPVSGTAFGTDEPATVGELAQMLYMLGMGEPADAESAYGTFSQYGLMAPGAATDDVLSNSAVTQHLNAFCTNGFGVDNPLALEASDEPLTRAQLAQIIFDFYKILAGE